MLEILRGSAHRYFLVSRGSLDHIVGIVRRADLVEFSVSEARASCGRSLHEPTTVFEGTSVLDTLRLFKQKPIEIATVVDEYDALQGIVSQTDLSRGDRRRLLPKSAQEEPEVREVGQGALRMDGGMSIYDVQTRLGIEMPRGQFNTLAGFILFLFDRVPAVGERVEWGAWSFGVRGVRGLAHRRPVLARRVVPAAGSSVSVSSIGAPLSRERGRCVRRGNRRLSLSRNVGIGSEMCGTYSDMLQGELRPVHPGDILVHDFRWSR